MKIEDITLVLSTLYWLPLCFRRDFKLLLLVFKALKLNGFWGPTYITMTLCGFTAEFLNTHYYTYNLNNLQKAPK